MKFPLHISLCGFGGQGIVLSSVILGTTAVTREDRYAVQTQSYGSEARGGQCQAELIIDDKPINSPVSESKDILVCMFQDAYNRYIPTVKESGVLIIDSGLVTNQTRKIARVFAIPATEIAVGLGNRMAANMVMMGFLSETCGVVDTAHLLSVIEETVSKRFIELNRKAVAAGVEYARERGLSAKEAVA